ncbi:MAG: hypothetical protein AAF236_16945, partial [Verrucomicrobiota bacterium]
MGKTIHWGLTCVASWLLSLGILGAQIPGTAEEPSVTGATGTRAGEEQSRSRVVGGADSDAAPREQIVVTGGDPRVRVRFRNYATVLRDEFRATLYKFRPELKMDRDSWKIPVDIELWGEMIDVYRGDNLRTKVEILTGADIRVALYTRLHDEFDERAMRIELLRALLLAEILDPVAGRVELIPDSLEVPSWVVQGLDQFLEHRRSGRPSAFFAGVLRSGLLLEPEEIFEQENSESLDPVSFAIFRSSAGAMIAALLDQEDGDIAFREFLGGLVQNPDAEMLAHLRQHFPSFRELDSGLEKWWALQVATLAEQQSFEYLSWEETDSRITEALVIEFDGTEKAIPGEGSKNL